MAVSSSTDFKSTASDLLTDARRLLGIHAEEQALSSTDLTIGLRAMTKMLKSWEVDGIGTWIATEGTLALVASDKDYVFGAGGSFATVPFEITQIRVSYSGGSENDMTPMSREEYYRLPDRTSEGYPSQYFYDRQRDSGTLYVWPVPPDGNYTITFTYRRRIMDLDASGDNFDLPPEWEDAITYNLAKRLMPVYGRGGTEEAKLVLVEAERLYQQVKMFDLTNDEGYVEILPARGRR